MIAGTVLSRMPSLSRIGGADRVRTDDFQLAKLALSRLSYGPSSQLGGPGKI
jgi:hypothetical protein